MKMGQKKLGFALLVSCTALGAVACGGGSAGPASGFTSASQLNAAMESPTGTVEPATAVGVAQAFENSNSSGLSGLRQKAQAQSSSIPCSGGGSISASGNSNTVTASYNNCTEGPCTMNGTGTSFIDGTDTSNICFSYNISETCTDPPIDIDLSFSGCLSVDLEGGFVYLVEYEGETYTVTGSYYDGTGTLEITGANGSFSCTYTADAGSCTSSTGEVFSFTADSANVDETDR